MNVFGLWKECGQGGEDRGIATEGDRLLTPANACFLPVSGDDCLPSARRSEDSEGLMQGIRDLLGNISGPFQSILEENPIRLDVCGHCSSSTQLEDGVRRVQLRRYSSLGKPFDRSQDVRLARPVATDQRGHASQVVENDVLAGQEVLDVNPFEHDKTTRACLGHVLPSDDLLNSLAECVPGQPSQDRAALICDEQQWTPERGIIRQSGQADRAAGPPCRVKE